MSRWVVCVCLGFREPYWSVWELDVVSIQLVSEAMSLDDIS